MFLFRSESARGGPLSTGWASQTHLLLEDFSQRYLLTQNHVACPIINTVKKVKYEAIMI